MKDKPHILFISSWYPSKSGSAGTFVELHLRALQSRGCKCAILISGEATLGNLAGKGFSRQKFLNYRKNPNIEFIENLTVHRRPLRLSPEPIAQRKKNILKTTKNSIQEYISHHGKPDLIFHHGVFDYCYLTQFVRNAFDLPVWYMENSPNMTAEAIPCANPFDSRADQVAFAKNAERRFAVTHSYVERMQALFGVPFEYCPNVITDDFFVAPETVKKDQSKFRFINIAILVERKNQRLILEAFADRFRNNKKYNLMIAGDGVLRDELLERASQLGIADQCEIPGYQSREQILALLDASHCFVLSSHSETFGVVLIEAMARGIPAISSRIDGPTEIVNADNGLLFTSNHADELGDRMQEIAENYDQYEPARIIHSVSSRFGSDAVKNALFPND